MTSRRRHRRGVDRTHASAPARVDRTTIHRRDETSRLANRLSAIRAKNRFWRAPMRHDAVVHENFFIAKNGDSESTQRAFGCRGRVATGAIALTSQHARVTETPAAQGFPSILTNACAAFPRTTRIVARMRCGVGDQHASRAPACVRQHFLKPDTVFLSVLVYSGCSAFRFPSARSD